MNSSIIGIDIIIALVLIGMFAVNASAVATGKPVTDIKYMYIGVYLFLRICWEMIYPIYISWVGGGINEI